MKAVPGILPTLLEMICFFSTPTIDVEPEICGKLWDIKNRRVSEETRLKGDDSVRKDG